MTPYHIFWIILTLELQLNKANTSDTEAPFLDLRLSISNGFVSPKFTLNRLLYLNLFALPEHLRMLMTSIIVTNS